MHVNEFNFLNNRNDSNDEQIDSPVIGSPKTVQEDNQPDDLPFKFIYYCVLRFYSIKMYSGSLH